MGNRIRRAAGTAWYLAKRSMLAAYAFCSFMFSLTRRRSSYVRERWPGAIDIEAATRVAVFTHFDRHGTVHDFVHYYLRQIRDAGYAILFVSNAPRLEAATIAKVTPLCAAILRRRNVGRDFGAFKDGIAAIPRLERLDSLLLANDSVYGPFHDLGPLIARMNPADADVWGIADSWDRRFHLQSFFLLFGRKALTSEAFARFWRQVRNVGSKYWIITRYEIGLTRTLMAGGLRCRALFPYRTAAATLVEAVKERDAVKSEELNGAQERFLANVCAAIDEGIPLNPTHFFWVHLVVAMGCPFLKRGLLRDNPMRIPSLRTWDQAIQSVSHYDTDLILRHLEVSARNRSV